MNETAIQLLGRTHVLVVHFPIALLWVAALAELFHRGTGRSPMAFTCLGLGAASAAAAAGLGWIHAEAEPLGSSVATTLFWHRWTGVAAAAVAVLAFALACAAREPGRAARSYRFGLLLSVALVSVGGHLGGTLVFGEGYFLDLARELVEDEPAGNGASEPAKPEPTTPEPAGPDAEPPPGAIADAAPANAATSEELWATAVRPLLEARCTECHGTRRKKGDLRLDDLRPHFARPIEERVIVPGDADGSELVRRVTLPAEHDDAMPAKGERLSGEEVELLRRWIDSGAAWTPPPETDDAEASGGPGAEGAAASAD